MYKCPLWRGVIPDSSAFAGFKIFAQKNKALKYYLRHPNKLKNQKQQKWQSIQPVYCLAMS